MATDNPFRNVFSPSSSKLVLQAFSSTFSWMLLALQLKIIPFVLSLRQGDRRRYIAARTPATARTPAAAPTPAIPRLRNVSGKAIAAGLVALSAASALPLTQRSETARKPVLRHWLLLIALVSVQVTLMLTPSTTLCQNQKQSHQRYLPESTVIAFSVRDYSSWQQKVGQSAIAKYFATEGVRLMIQDMSKVSDGRLGVLNLLQQKFIRRYAKQQVTLAIVQGQDDAFVLFIDCQDENEAAKCMAEIRAATKKNGSPLQAQAAGTTVVVANDFAVIEKIATTTKANSLQNKSSFRSTVGKSSGDGKQGLFWFYVDPLALASRKSGKPLFARINMYLHDFAKREGLDAIQGLGGTGNVNDSGQKMEMVGFIDAKQPYRRGMRMLDLENVGLSSKPDWLRGSISHGFANLRLDKGLESFSTVFDTVVGEGEEGIFRVVLDDLKNDRKGPRVDVANEIIANLKSPLYFSNRVNNGTVYRLMGIQTMNSDGVRRAIDKIYAGDPQATKIPQAGFDAWQVKPLQKSGKAASNSFVVAIRNDFVLIAPNLATINDAFSQSSSNDSWFSPQTSQILGSESSLGYACDLNQLFELRHGELKQGRATGGIGQILQTARVQDKLGRLNRGNWPDFNALPVSINSKFRALAASNREGWKFVVEISE